MYNPKMDVEFDHRAYLIDRNVPEEVVELMSDDEVIEEAIRIDREGQANMY